MGEIALNWVNAYVIFPSNGRDSSWPDQPLHWVTSYPCGQVKEENMGQKLAGHQLKAKR